MIINVFTSWIKDGEETILINTKNQKCIILDRAGSEIWEQFTEVISINKAINNLENKYKNSNIKTIEEDVNNLYKVLLENQMIEEEI